MSCLPENLKEMMLAPMPIIIGVVGPIDKIFLKNVENFIDFTDQTD